MSSGLCLIEIIFNTSGYHIYLMIKIMLQYFKKIHYLWLIVNEGKHDNSEGILHLGMFIEKIKDDICICILSELYNYPHPFPVGLIPYGGYTLYFFILYKIRHILYKIGFIYHIWKLCHNYLTFSVRKSFNIRYSPASYFTSSRKVSFLYASCSKYFASGRKIRPFYYMHEIIYRSDLILYLIIYKFYNRTYNLP